MEEMLASICSDEYLRDIRNYVPSAWIGHAPFLKFLIREYSPRTFVELGTQNGFSYFVATQAILENGLDCRAWAVDHWKGDEHAGFYDNSVYESVVKINQKYRKFSTLLKMSFDEALQEFGEASIDLLHIDGHHSYDSVKNDFEKWLPKMSSDGIILFHDIHVYRKNFGVFILWNEIKEKYKSIEFTFSHGLGVIFLGKTPEGKLQKFFEHKSTGDNLRISGAFGSIADDVMQQYRILCSNKAQSLEVANQTLELKLNAIEKSTIWKATKLLRILLDLKKSRK
jgi:hypothetical protein